MKTIPLDTMRAVRRVVAHGPGCPDGVAAVVLCKDALPSATVEFCQYDTPEHRALGAEPGMLFVDFSPHPSRVAEFAAAGAVVLDHHRTARAVVEAAGPLGVFADEAEEPGVSGAVLAFRHAWAPLWLSRPRGAMKLSPQWAGDFASLAGVRDTWVRDSPRWEEACAQAAALRFWPVEDLLAALQHHDAGKTLDGMLAVGGVLVRKHAEEVKRAVDGAVRLTCRGVTIAVISGCKYTSDAADVADADGVVGFDYLVDSDGSRKLALSTRSRSDRFDCAAFCRGLGGVGHTKAAGCALDVLPDSRNPWREVEREVVGYFATLPLP